MIDPWHELRKGGRFKNTDGNVKTGEIAFVIDERHQSFATADILELERHRRVCHFFAQHFDRETVTRMDTRHAAAMRHHRLQFKLQFRRHTIQHGRHPRGDALIGPKQFFAEQRQFGSTPALQKGQRTAEQISPAQDESPKKAIGNFQLGRRLAYRPSRLNCLERRQQPPVEIDRAGIRRRPLLDQFDSDHLIMQIETYLLSESFRHTRIPQLHSKYALFYIYF